MEEQFKTNCHRLFHDDVTDSELSFEKKRFQLFDSASGLKLFFLIDFILSLSIFPQRKIFMAILWGLLPVYINIEV
jgi:hypothetical protein